MNNVNILTSSRRLSPEIKEDIERKMKSDYSKISKVIRSMDDRERRSEISKKLMEEPLYLSDEFRDWKLIHEVLFKNFSNKNNIFYEIGEWGGLVGFVNIIPKFKCDIVFKLWNPELWGFKFKTQIKELIKTIMEKYDLKRVSTESSDERMSRLAKIIGFKIEGRFKCGFAWEGELYTLYKMRLLREEVEKW